MHSLRQAFLVRVAGVLQVFAVTLVHVVDTQVIVNLVVPEHVLRSVY